MDGSRRKFLRVLSLSGISVMIAGCGQSARSSLPGVAWPDVAARPTVRPGDIYTARPEPTGPTTGRPTPAPSSSPVPDAITRGRWARAEPIMGRINPMNGIRRITLHHEGAPNAPVYFTDEASSSQRLESIRSVHVDRNYADIGYHYIIDRSGRVWEGRSLAYQGAHVRNENEHNIGVMVLGNFEIQQPSDAQIAAMQSVVRQLARHYRVRAGDIYTHQELGPSACPGRNLQPTIARLRSNGQFT